MTEGEVIVAKQLLRDLAEVSKGQLHGCLFAFRKGKPCAACNIEQFIKDERQKLREVTKSWPKPVRKEHIHDPCTICSGCIAAGCSASEEKQCDCVGRLRE